MTVDHRAGGYQEAKERRWRQDRNEKEEGESSAEGGPGRCFRSPEEESGAARPASAARRRRSAGRAGRGRGRATAGGGVRLGAGPRPGRGLAGRGYGGRAGSEERRPAEEVCAGLRRWAGPGPPTLTPRCSPPRPPLYPPLAALPRRRRGLLVARRLLRVGGVRDSLRRVVRAAGPLRARPPCRLSWGGPRPGRAPARVAPPAGEPGTASTAASPDPRTGSQPAPQAHGVMRHLPYFCRGQVVRGFGRGSKQLGIPTANFPEQVVDNLPADVSTGIYYGWASVGSGDVHKMVVSIGWNPYYKNTKKSMETHIIHTFKEDFYGEILNVAIVGYLRPEKNFDSLESLISAIQGDIEEAKKRLDLPEHLKFKEDNFFQVPKNKILNGH